jgi:multidrug efflux pump
MLGGRQVTRFKQNGKQYDVMVQVADVERTDPDDLSKIYVRGANGQMIQLSNLVDLRESVAPRELGRMNQMRSADITANVAPGYSQGEALLALEEAARRVLPQSVGIDYIGQAREFKQASGDIYFTFVLALLFIYLVLAAQFESFIDPFIIMLTVPLSMTGALLALKYGGGTMNIYSQVGLVTLVGLITKNGILIVEFSNQLQEQGRSRLEAVIEASALRLRPILMTTGAMVLGAVPLATAMGAGAESRNQIGLVIVGGLLLGTLLTLFVVPTAYTLLARERNTEAKPAEAAASGHAAPHPVPGE